MFIFWATTYVCVGLPPCLFMWLLQFSVLGDHSSMRWAIGLFVFIGSAGLREWLRTVVRRPWAAGNSNTFRLPSFPRLAAQKRCVFHSPRAWRLRNYTFSIAPAPGGSETLRFP
jgi:hypothetical protein